MCVCVRAGGVYMINVRVYARPTVPVVAWDEMGGVGVAIDAHNVQMYVSVVKVAFYRFYSAA